MFAICVESSHKMGMGHLFRMLNFAKFLKSQGEQFVFIVNDNTKAKSLLSSEKYTYEIASLKDFNLDWESRVIQKYGISYWINDRLDTDEKSSQNILKNNIKLITFDDLGTGAKYSDINICGLFFDCQDIQGKMILKGIDYLILNDDVDKYRKQRRSIKNILVTLGGSDTYGVTVKIVRLLKKYKLKATIHTGPSFEHLNELKQELNDNFVHTGIVPSLVKEFAGYDLAITGGGITPFEANASGLPCLIVANELFEIPNALFLQNLGSSLFLGYYKELDDSIFSNIEKIGLLEMSNKGILGFDTKASRRIYKEILDL